MDKVAYIEVTKYVGLGKDVKTEEFCFKDSEKLKKFYDIAKREKNCLINVRFYDVMKYPNLATEFDFLINKNPKDGFFYLRRGNATNKQTV